MKKSWERKTTWKKVHDKSLLLFTWDTGQSLLFNEEDESVPALNWDAS